MKRRLFLASAGVIALLVVISVLGREPTARADTSSMEWDMAMTDQGPTANGPVCPSNADNVINVGECPETQAHFNIGQNATPTKQEPFFDMATEVWQTGPPGADLDGDTLPEPSTGLAHLRPAIHGTTEGKVTFTTKNNIQVADLVNNNIDDVGANADTTVAGQPPVCGAAGTGTFTPLPFFLWQSDIGGVNLVPYNDTGGPKAPQTQEDHYSFGQNCMNTTPGYGIPNGIPDGVDCTPSAIPGIQAAMGLPLANYVDRGFGVANLPVLPPAVTVPVDVNFLYYNLVSVPSVQGYVQVAVVQYPGTPYIDPTKPGYDPTNQTVITCPPYTTNVQIYGITQSSDFTIPADGVIDLVTPPEKHRELTGGTSNDVFNFYEMKSTFADWDGDTIPALFNGTFDRCSFDPASGTAAQDTDGDTLTGLCETLTGPGIFTNGEGATPGPNANNPGPFVKVPPWSAGQDVDGDGYLNFMDNCPIIPDRDLNGDTVIDYQKDTDKDGVGDVCEIDLAPILGWAPNAYLIPGDGHGYPSQSVGDQVQVVGPNSPVVPNTAAPGKFVDRDNVCADPFHPNTAEVVGDTGRWCAGFDAVPAPNVALGRVVADSNDNATPDLLDYPAGAPIEWADTKSDSDFDGYSDGCEAYMGSDPLDPNSIPLYNFKAAPAGGPTAADCNAYVASLAGGPPYTGTDTNLPKQDGDRDGCARSEEDPGAAAPAPGSTAAGGVSFQDQAWYDFYDVPVPSLKVGAGTYSGAVTMGDVLAVLSYVGEHQGTAAYEADANGNGIRDGLEYDRSPSPAPNPPWDAGPPSGAVAMSDVLAALAQVGQKCSLGKHF